MIKAKYSILLLIGLFLAGCSINGLTHKVTKIKNNDYVFYYPEKVNTGQVDLVYLITPTGDAGSVYKYVKIWEPYLVKNNLAVASVIDWDQNKLKTIFEYIQKQHSFRKVFVTGFSNGGYNSCYFASLNPGQVNGIIPMGAFCRNSGTLPPLPQVPILAVVGEKDTWARGDDLQMVKDYSEELKTLGIEQVEKVIPGLGHTYPVSALPEVITWIKKH